MSRASIDVFGIQRVRLFEKKKLAGCRNVDCNMRTLITMYRIGRNVKRRNRVAEHQCMSGECIPIDLGNPVTGFTYIEPFSEGHKFVASRVAVGCITWANKVSIRRQTREVKVINAV